MKFFKNIFIVVLVGSFSFSSNASDLSTLRDCVKNGYDGLANRHAIVAAVVDGENSQVLLFGTAKEDQIFEIGSISKTFTANLLAQQVSSGNLKLSDPIPPEYQKQGSTITYQHLTTHTSGIIAGIFPGFNVSNQLFPFDGLTIPTFKNLYSQTPLDAAPGTSWSYSNMGIALLGLVLADNSGTTYEQQIEQKIFRVLGMGDSYFEVPASEMSRFPHGYMIDPDGKAQDMPPWDLFKTAIDPAGGIRSSIQDMIKYTRANLAPASSPLVDSVLLSHQQLFRIKDPGVWIGMNWILQPGDSLIWHNGQTYGFNSILAISTKRNQAVVAMTDTTVMLKDAQGNTSFDSGLQNVAFSCLK